MAMVLLLLLVSYVHIMHGLPADPSFGSALQQNPTPLYVLIRPDPLGVTESS